MSDPTNNNSLAIWVSFVSAGIAVFSLGWNIYRDVILKARLRVKFALVSLHANQARIEKLNMTITNMGPGKVVCGAIYVRDYSLWKMLTGKSTLFFLVHDYLDGMSANLPQEINVGEQVNYYFSPTEEEFISKEFTHIGVRDTFDRMHWAKKKDVLRTKSEWQKRFGGKPQK